jgi:hypothetical protein
MSRLRSQWPRGGLPPGPASGEVEYASFPATSRVLDAFVDRSESCPAVSVDVASLSSLPLSKAGVTPRSRKTVFYIIMILLDFLFPTTTRHLES